MVPFDFSGQPVRVLTDEHGDPWFVAADVCTVLDIANASDAVSRLADDEKGVGTTDTLGGPQQVRTVSEAGLYRLIFTSRRAEAETFRRWVTHEVLPQIRRTGSYSTQAVPTEIDAGMLRQIAAAMEAKDQRIAVLEPRAEVADRLLDATTDLSVADAAKVLTRSGAQIGRDRLFTVLSHLGWIYRGQGDRRWHVYQRAIAGGWLSVLPGSHYHPRTGELVMDVPQVRVTPKGLQRLLTELTVAA